jgi:hypothetical protein
VLSIVEFSPTRGAPGESVKIFGTEFSPTAVQNRVTFSQGASRSVVPAPVLWSTSTTIVARVPPGATTGPITVSTLEGSATSNGAFVVTEAPLARPSGRPQVLSVVPAIVAGGDTVTVSGNNFSTLVADTAVAFNGAPGSIRWTTATEVEVVLPATASSGRVTVTTQFGTSSSSRDLFVVPQPYSVADVGCTGRVLVNGSARTFSVRRPQTLALDLIGLVVFDGSAGHRLGLALTDLTIADLDVSVLDPETTTVVGSTRVDATRAAHLIELPSLPVTGTYAIVLCPRRMHTGHVTLTLTAS